MAALLTNLHLLNSRVTYWKLEFYNLNMQVPQRTNLWAFDYSLQNFLELACTRWRGVSRLLLSSVEWHCVLWNRERSAQRSQWQLGHGQSHYNCIEIATSLTFYYSIWVLNLRWTNVVSSHYHDDRLLFYYVE